MDVTMAKLTVYFEDPFWVGVYERSCGGSLEACRIVFGAEPKDCDVYAVFLDGWRGLRFSPPVAAGEKAAPKPNPKRMQRAIKHQLAQTGVGTKAQQALKLQQEQRKSERKQLHKQRTAQEEAYRRLLHQQKKKEKHKGH